ncbi:LOW QUALITY PROTEIN: hypothetical protein M514_20937, partial [Trichuris suis]
MASYAVPNQVISNPIINHHNAVTQPGERCRGWPNSGHQRKKTQGISVQVSKMWKTGAQGLELSFDKRQKVQQRKWTTSAAGFIASAFTSVAIRASHDEWIYDSGATVHMTRHREFFPKYVQFASPKQVNIGDGRTIQAVGKGTIAVEVCIRRKWLESRLLEVLHVPEIRVNLFSQTASAKRGCNWSQVGASLQCKRDGRIVITGHCRDDGLWALHMRVKRSAMFSMAASSSEAGSLQLYHERLGHQNKRHVQSVLQKYGIAVTAGENEVCEGCAYGKQTRKSFSIREERPTVAGGLINADVCGPMSVTSLGGARYFLALPSETEVAGNLKQFLAEAETAGHRVSALRADNGSEFDNRGIQNILAAKGITFLSSMPYTPEQNGCSERENRTLVDCARSMLESKKLPKFLWAEAVATAAYIYNLTGRTPEEGKSPYELWHNRTVPKISHLRVFGTECFVHIPKQQRQKWSRKSDKGILVGYENFDGYRVFIPSQRKVVRSCHVQFAKEKLSSVGILLEESKTTSDMTIRESSNDSVELRLDLPDAGTADTGAEEAGNGSGQTVESTTVGAEMRNLRDRAQLRKPVRFDDYVLLSVDAEVPKSYAEAMRAKESMHWKKAMEDEMQSLAENQTWVLTDLPADKKVLSCRWVLRVKTKADGTVDRYKARLVAKGFAQKYGIDYDETFSPVARFDTVRTILAVSADEDLVLRQFDVKTAFLYGSLEEEVYMKQPEGFDDGSGRVCKLQRSLYGLKQAPRCWNTRFKEFIRKQKLEQCHADPCLFVRIENGKKLIVAIYVDDGLVAGSSNEEVKQFLEELQREFKITVGSLDCFLGMQIQRRKDGSVFVCQKGYCEKILNKFNMAGANKVSTPCVKHTQETEEVLDDNTPYRSAVGSLMYLAIATRPDIAFAVSTASQKLESPTKADWEAVKRIFKYLRGTTDFGILYKAK